MGFELVPRIIMEMVRDVVQTVDAEGHECTQEVCRPVERTIWERIFINDRFDANQTGIQGTPPAQTGDPEEDIRVVTASAGLNLRSSPEMGDNVLTTLPEGTQVRVIQGGPDDEWVQVQTLDGTRTGWVAQRFLATPDDVEGTTGVAPPVSGPAGSASPYAPFTIRGDVQVNGRIGVHWDATLSTPAIDGRVTGAIQRAQDLGAGYAVILVDPYNPTGQDLLIQELQANGITPVVRLYMGRTPDQWTDADIDAMANAAEHLAVNMNVDLIQVGNEPNIEGAAGITNEAQRAEYLERSIDRQVDALVAVNRAVQGTDTLIGIPPMAGGAAYVNEDTIGAYSAEEYFVDMVEAIAERETREGIRLVGWVPTHTYTWPGDGDFIESNPGCDCARGYMGFGPEVSDDYERLAEGILGYDVTALSTEGGPAPEAIRAGDQPGTAEGMVEGLVQVQNNPYLTQALWLSWESSPGSDNWDNWALYGDAGAYGLGLQSYYDAYQNR